MLRRFDINWGDRKLNSNGELCATVTINESRNVPFEIIPVDTFAISISDGCFRMHGLDNRNLPLMTEAEHEMLSEICYAYYDCFMGQHSIYFWVKD